MSARARTEQQAPPLRLLSPSRTRATYPGVVCCIGGSSPPSAYEATAALLSRVRARTPKDSPDHT